jgi:hypothetical protein
MRHWMDLDPRFLALFGYFEHFAASVKAALRTSTMRHLGFMTVRAL